MADLAFRVQFLMCSGRAGARNIDDSFETMPLISCWARGSLVVMRPETLSWREQVLPSSYR